MPQHKIYVGNIAYAAKIEELQVLFEPYGDIEDIAMATDKETGKFRGFAIVMMPNSDEAAKAIEGVDGHRLRGRRLVVNPAIKKAKTDSGPVRPEGGTAVSTPRRIRATDARVRRGGRNPRRGGR